MFVDGQLIEFSKYDNVEPTIIGGNTLIPVRALTDSLGANLLWKQSKKLIKIKLMNKTIELTINSNIAIVNGKEVKLQVPAKSINGRVLIPLRFVSEIFSKTVEWHPYNDKLKVIAIY